MQTTTPGQLTKKGLWFNRLEKLFEKKHQPAPDDDGKSAEVWYEHKSKLMEEILGREHDMVMHAIIPDAVGGGLDLYYFPQGIPGTAIATKELSELPDQGAANGGQPSLVESLKNISRPEINTLPEQRRPIAS